MSSPDAPDAADREFADPADAEGQDGVGRSGAATGGAGQDAGERAWWDDPRLPWRGKPGRADIGCWTAIAIIGVYALVLLPLRPVLLGLNPYVLVALNGSRSGTVAIGAQAAALGDHWWPLGLVLGTVSVLKFDWVYWWAGKLWGHGLIDVIAGRSPRAARNAARAEAIAAKIGGPAVFLSYYIPIIPVVIIYASVGAAGMKLRKFLLYDILGAITTRALFMYLGYRIGEPAIKVVELIAKYSWYLSLAIIAGMIITALWRRSRGQSATVGGGVGR